MGLCMPRTQTLTRAASACVRASSLPHAADCHVRACRTIVALLREHNVAFEHFDILEDEEVRQGLKKLSNWPTYPQVRACALRVCGVSVRACFISIVPASHSRGRARTRARKPTRLSPGSCTHTVNWWEVSMSAKISLRAARYAKCAPTSCVPMCEQTYQCVRARLGASVKWTRLNGGVR